MSDVAWMFVALGIIVLGTYLGIAVYRMSGVPLGVPKITPCSTGGHAITNRDPWSLGLGFFEVAIQSPFCECPAWYVPAGPNTDTWAVIVHGRGGDRSSSLDMLPVLHGLGISSLVVSYRGDGTADDSWDGLDHLGATEWIDVQAAMQYAQEHGAKKLILVGRSAGGSIVCQVLSKSGMGQHVAGVILEDPVLDWRSVFMHMKPEWMPRWLARVILWVASVRIDTPLDRLDFVTYPPVWRPPLLIVHGEDDEMVPYSISKRFLRARTLDRGWPTAKLVGVPGATHGMSRMQDPGWFDELIAKWFSNEVEVKT